jgi:transposase
MQVLYAHCCGLDVHKKSVVACLITPKGRSRRTFGTLTRDLLEMADWLRSEGCEALAMESTGVFWKPVYNLLEPTAIKLFVVNAAHIKAVPGRKSDVKDAEWIAELLRHGLLKASFIPDRPQRELRELVRYRSSLVEERAREANRIQKVLEGANVKLTSVVSNVLGVSGRAMLEAIVAGTTDPSALAALGRPRLQASKEELEAALQGSIGAHQRLMLSTQLRHIGFLDNSIAELDQLIEAQLRPVTDELARLDTIPGVSERIAQTIIACIGSDMARFPSAAHLASWAKLCPGLDESAGKRGSARTGKGNALLRTALTEAAWAASHTKTYLGTQFHRLAAKRGKKRAIIAVAHTILTIVYHLLKKSTAYQELGVNYFDQRSKEATTRRAVRRLEALGYQVILQPVA